MMPPRHCCRCGAELPATAAPHARYCSPACRNAAYKARKRAERADRIHAQFSERAEAPKAAAPVGEEECAALVMELAMAATTLKEAAQTRLTDAASASIMATAFPDRVRAMFEASHGGR